MFEFGGQRYRFVRLPFGLSIAPLGCTQLLNVVSFELRRAGVRHVRYLDDFLYIAKSARALAVAMQRAAVVLARFGLVVNPSKTVGPTQDVVFLGVGMDSRSCTLYVTSERVAEVKQLCSAVARRRSVTARELQSLVGKMSFCATVLPGARPFCRHLITAVNGVSRHSHHIHITGQMRADLRFWVRYFDVWNGRQQWHGRPDDVVIATDASTVGDGAGGGGFGVVVEKSCRQLAAGWCEGAGAWGVWSPHHAAEAAEVGWCELAAALFALQMFAPQLRDASVRIVLDNSAAVHIINRYSTRSARLLPLLRAMCGLCLQYNISMRASPGCAQRPAGQSVAPRASPIRSDVSSTF